MKSTQKKSNIFVDSELEYMNDLIHKSNLSYLTNEQILENIKNYRSSKNPIYLNIVVTNFIKLLVKKARKYKKPGINIGDLIHYGIEGLIKAIDKSFNLDANEKFITYITIIIERRMKDGLDIQRSAVMLPKNIMTEQRKFKFEHNAKISESVHTEESESELELSNDIIYSKLNIEDFVAFKDILSLEQINILDTSVETKLDSESLQFDVFYVLEAILNPIEKDVLMHSFGLNGENAKAFDAISLLLDISSQKVRKIRNVALSKIRNNSMGMSILEKYLY